MDSNLELDLKSVEEILSKVLNEATNFLHNLDTRPVSVLPPQTVVSSLPTKGLGAEKTLEEFNKKYATGIIASSGPRYFGFVTGGATPAAIAGDWLVSVFDQNVTRAEDSSAPYIERETIKFLRELFNLSDSHFGTFVTGATISNFVGLALARQWAAHHMGVDTAQDGLYALSGLKVFSASPHSSIFKALSMLGMGRSSVQRVPSLENREAVDLVELRKALSCSNNQPCIVVANAGTVDTVDFDNLKGIIQLKQEFNFWLHVDAAFGGFAACSPKYSYLVEGLDAADSITIDAHKWLNVPYDSAMQFTQHKEIQIEVFQNNAAYLGSLSDNPDFVHLTPENSRRLRALPAWFSLMAYGKQGYQEIVERNCELAQLLGEKIKSCNNFKLLSPVRLNVACFTLVVDIEISSELINKFLAALRDTGEVFLSATVYKGVPAIRAALTNWRTERTDIDIAWEALLETISTLKKA